ncbi:MAG: hypothetical protein K0U86_19805 [Planctomycetes bacterium]|nr:hypothetical protein [Planctomycetota bacterium]MCH9727146.1 hypothetical protein [Planctomycetota bacterium]MCH9778539.1 hypothetical protein [Planctomycetota bacterium]MDF1742682.1 hypothetical protein [Gimesia sp.]
MNVEFNTILAGHTNEISEAFRNRSLLQENGLLISATIVIGLVWVSLYLWENFQVRRKALKDTPQGLFYDLCKTNRLSRADINYLLKATTEHYSDQPAMIFINPQILKNHISETSSDTRYYEKLAQRLFQK